MFFSFAHICTLVRYVSFHFNFTRFIDAFDMFTEKKAAANKKVWILFFSINSSVRHIAHIAYAGKSALYLGANGESIGNYEWLYCFICRSSCPVNVFHSIHAFYFRIRLSNHFSSVSAHPVRLLSFHRCFWLLSMIDYHTRPFSFFFLLHPFNWWEHSSERTKILSIIILHFNNTNLVFCIVRVIDIDGARANRRQNIFFISIVSS